MPCSSSASAIPTGVTLDLGYAMMLPAHSSHAYCGLFWSLLNIHSWIWLGWQLRSSRRYEISHDCGLPTSWGYSKSSRIGYCKCVEGQHKPDETLQAPRVLSFSCRLPQWNICSCGEMSCRATGSLWENSFHVPRWSCSAPPWQVTSRAWNPTSCFTQTNPSSCCKTCQRFYATWKGLVLMFRTSYSATIAHARKLQEQGSL